MEAWRQQGVFGRGRTSSPNLRQADPNGPGRRRTPRGGSRGQHHFLRHIRGIRLLQPVSPAVGKNEGSVEPHEFTPCLVVPGVAEAHHQARPGDGRQAHGVWIGGPAAAPARGAPEIALTANNTPPPAANAGSASRKGSSRMRRGLHRKSRIGYGIFLQDGLGHGWRRGAGSQCPR